MFFLSDNIFFLIIGFVISLIISMLLFIVTFFFSPRSFDFEKSGPYECGFQPFEDSRSKFDVKYYLVGILYIIFDLEIMFLLPWVVNFSILSSFGFVTMFIFFFLLILGFIYE